MPEKVLQTSTMALNIRHPETEALAATVAALAGETKTEAVAQALRERLARLERATAGRDTLAELRNIASHCASLPVLDARTPAEILGYGDTGLPR
jgi:antitoxin VapB